MTHANEEAIRQLLLECGFKNLPRARSTSSGFRWAVVGDLDGGFQLVVRCVTGGRGELVLLVPSESAKQWLGEILTQNGATAVDIRAERIERSTRVRWLTARACP
jgi:hypothetical protein